MLVIRDLPDLLKYLETRKEMAEKQTHGTRADLGRGIGMVYAYEQSIEAVKALMTNNHEEERE